MDIFTKAKWARILVATCVAFVVGVSGLGFWLANSISSRGAGEPASVELEFNDHRVFAAGAYHTLAIDNGRLFGWGSNQYGQVGNNTKVNQSLPVQIGAATNWKSVATGGMHSLAINSLGQLYAWGQNTYGQLGLNNTTEKIVPTQVGTETNWAMVAAGAGHSLAINNVGELWAWGLNDFGQVGDETTTNRLAPVRIGTLTNWTYVEAGYVHSYAINTDKKLFSWGANGAGQLGLGDIADRDQPTQVGTANWKSISAGTLHTLAINEDGTLYAWGDNTNGQIGDGTIVQKHAPVQIDSRTNWITVSGGHGHSLATNHDGQLFTWGGNNAGQLGTGNTTNTRSLTQITAENDWIDVAAGYVHSFAMNNDKQVVAFGDNAYSQLGDGLSANRTSVTRVFPLLDVVAPNSGTGYDASAASKTQVSPRGNDSYTFTVTSKTGYKRAAPIVRWKNPDYEFETGDDIDGKVNENGLKLNPTAENGDIRTYTVTNVTSPVSASDFTIEMPIDVAAAADGLNYTVGLPSKTFVYPGETYTFEVTRAPLFADPTVTCSKADTVVTQVGTSDVFTVTVSNINEPISSGDFTVFVSHRYDVEAPVSVADVFTVSNLSENNVIEGESYSFTITSLTGYTNGEPKIILNPALGTLSSTVVVSGNARTYTVLNVKGKIVAGDFTIDMPKNVSVPLVDGVAFTISAPSVNHVYTGDTYTFTVTRLDSIFDYPDITLPVAKGDMGAFVQSGENFTYTVSNVKGPINSSDFITDFNLTTYKIATPSVGVGYSVSDLTSDRIVTGGSYTFSITSFFGYTNADPAVTLRDGAKAKLAPGFIKVDNTRRYTVNNVTGDIEPSDFTVQMPLNVWGPNSAGSGYIISGETTNYVFSGGSFSFYLTLQEGYNLQKIMLSMVGEIAPVETNGNVYKYTIQNITTPIVSNNYTVLVDQIMYAVETPANGKDGYRIFSQSVTSVKHKGAYTFTLISQTGYNNGAPIVTLNATKGTVTLTNTSGNTRTYTVSNVLGPIETTDFEVIMPYNVASPSGGKGYSVSIPSTTYVFDGGSYTFIVTRGAGFTAPVVEWANPADAKGQLVHTNTDENKFMYTVSNITGIITASDFSIETTQVISVAVPLSGSGYAVSQPSRTTVEYEGSYTFTITRDANYTNPTVALNVSTATLTLSHSSLNVFTYTVSNITATISPLDFIVTIERIFNVAGPKDGTGYNVSDLSQTSIVYGETYTFKIKIKAGYTDPVVNLNSVYGDVRRLSIDEDESVYEVYNITGNISSSDFSVVVSRTDGSTDTEPENNNQLDWMIWLIILIVLLLVIFICVRVAIKTAKKNRQIKY